MNIQELDAYNLADAVKFNDHLNPALWDKSEHLRDDVRAQLLLIAEDFRESLGIKDLDLKDITISGSNAAYTYTPNSDIDLHLVVDQPEDPVYRELFDAKKAQYNDTHDIKIKGFDVEVYVESADRPPVSQGMYSLLQDRWIQVPRRVRADVDDTATRNKFETVGHAIERAVKTGDRELMDRVAGKIKRMRQTGLDAHGEFGPENLAFKMLRSQGVIKQLHDARVEAKNKELSLKERRKPHSVFRYGFKHEESINEVGMTPDGTSPHTCMIVDAEEKLSDEEILKDFIDFCSKELKLEHMPVIKLRKDPQWPVAHKTFGRYTNDRNLLEVAWGQRHVMDVLRTVAHELTHKHQHERDGSAMGPEAGETGSPYENEANARAGVLMRDYARLHPDYFAVGQAEELHGDEVNESASGYIPTKKQANDPRYKMALTVDIRPGQLGKEANKLKLKTDKQGHPQQANPNGLFEQLMMEWQASKLDRSEMTVKQLAQKHKVSREQINDQLKKGIRVEKEHTSDEATAREIALDHLAEFPDYYDRLKKAEQPAEQLDEVSMRPSTLKQFATSPEAEGIQAGFEAELIFRDTESDGSGDQDWEPDYDADERVHSISDIIDFFSNDEYGYGLGSRDRRNLEEKLDEVYYEWYDEQMYRAFKDEEQELIKEIWLEEKPMEQRIYDMLVDGLDLSDEEADRAMDAGKAAPKFKNTDDQEIYASENEAYENYIQAAEGAEEILDEDVESSISNQDKFYDDALNNFRDDFQIDDDSGFFSDQGWRWMSDIAEAFDLAWPVMSGSGGNGGGRSWDEIADSLKSAVDMPVKVSSGYHSATRKPGLWIVEPDSSLDPDDYTDFGLEIVSPPMPLVQALAKLDQVVAWANGPGNAYTNESTSIHMGISVPYKGGAVDYLKLVLFLGDEYVLKQYQRETSVYCKSVFKEIKNRATTEKTAKGAMELLKNNLIELAERELVKTTGEAKYSSAHKHGGKYIEFRSAGKDWLKGTQGLTEGAVDTSGSMAKLENTMMRYAYAMYLASRPDLERKEYAKKLYKLITPESDNSIMNLFSRYAAGTIDKEQFKKDWARQTLAKDEPSSVEKGRWVVVDKSTGRPVPGQTYTNYTREEVWARAKQTISPGSSANDFNANYDIEPEYTGKWEVYRDDTGQEEQLEIVDAPTRGQAVDLAYDRYTGVIPYKVRPYYGDGVEKPKSSPRAQLAKRIIQKPKEQPPAQQPAQQAPAQSGDKADWEYYSTVNGRTLDRINNVTNAQAEEVISRVADREDIPVQNVGIRRVEESQNWNLKNRDTGEAVYRINNMSRQDAAQYALNWLRQQGLNSSDYQILPVDQPTGTPGVDWRRDLEQHVQQAQQPAATPAQPQQATAPNGVPMWEVYQRDNGHVVHTFADHDQRSAWAQAQGWLRNIGAEDASLFSVRAKMTTTNESFARQLLACAKGPWLLSEDTGNVQVVKSSMFDSTFIPKVQKFPNLEQKLQNFIEFKKENPGKSWGGSDASFIAAGPIGRALPKLRHAHLSQDVSVFYTIEGRDPMTIKLYGTFSHAESGTSNTSNIKVQKSLAKKLINAESVTPEKRHAGRIRS